MSSTMQHRDKWIPWYFVIFFLVIAAVDGVMVTLAVRTRTGIVTEHAYEKGLAYNRVIAAEEKQRALGWSGEITYTGNSLHFMLRDENHTRIVPYNALATITRPTQAGMDFTVALNDERTRIDFPAPGLWEVRIQAHVRGEDYQQSARIVVQ